MSSLFAERIARGMAYLDDVAPDWEWRINLDKFHLNNCFACVLGQLFGHFHKYKNGHGFSEQWAVDRGFSLEFERIPDYQTLNYQTLTNEWDTAIRDRREAGKAAHPALQVEPAVCFEMGEICS